MNKRAAVYVIVATFFIAVMAIVFLILAEPPRGSFTSSSERVLTMDKFLTDFESDIDRATYIAAFRSMLAMEEYVSQNGVYFTNLSAPFQEAFVQGTINGTESQILLNSTIEDYALRTEQIAGQVGITLAINVTKVVLVQDDPWNVRVNLSFTVNVSDARGTASWNYNFTRSTLVPITDLRDPIYSVSTLGKVQNQVKAANITLFVNDTGNRNDTSALQSFINLSLYRASTRAPSFLMRFTGNLSASPYGIESIVNIPRLSSQDIIINSSLSTIDYLYFGGGTPSNQSAVATACTIQNLVYVPDWFRLDAAHLPDYNITGALSYSACP